MSREDEAEKYRQQFRGAGYHISSMDIKESFEAGAEWMQKKMIMTQKDKELLELLLKDLCARLPYGVKAEYYDPEAERNNWDIIEDLYNANCINHVEVGIGQYGLSLNEIKPYLFPLSSMTEEQKRELRQMDAFINTFGNVCFAVCDEYGHDIIPTYEDAIRITNWLNKNHFDYRGLIEKGLALDATNENIY